MMHNFYGPGVYSTAQGDFWWMGASMIAHLLFWIVVIYFTVKLINKYFHKANDSKVKEDTAIYILRERYAKGEIDSEEFKQRKAELE